MMIKRSIAIGFELWEVEPVWRNIFISALVGTAVLLFHPGEETTLQTGATNQAAIYDPIQGNNSNSHNNQQSIIFPSNKPTRQPIALAPVIEADDSFQAASQKKENKSFGTVGDEVIVESQLIPTHSL